ncbi:MAG: hypothetical protein ACRD3O_01915 [Terriglobia bacterium]
MIFVTVLLISLTGALPGVYQERQREREEAAIFRAEQYTRAIYLFHRTLGRYPNSVKELLSTNGVRYLRQAYPDPLSPNHRWRFIHATASGIILDSITESTTAPGQNTGAPNANGPGAASSSSSGPSGGPSPFSSGFSAQTGQAAAFSAGSSETGSFGGQTSATQKKPKPSPDCQAPQEGSFSSSDAQTGTMLGAVIVGIAPCNDKKSIRVLDKQDEYDKWEFLGTNYVPYQLPKTQVVRPSSSFQNSGSGQPQSPFQGPAQPGIQNTPSQNMPNQNPGAP